jgi:mannose-6-phosphate isomerase-like protein (cupin superfamily)
MSELRPFDPETFSTSVATTPLAPVDAGYHLVEWVADPDGNDPPMLIAPVHVHWDDDETWYVLEGRLSVLLGDRIVTIPAGGAVTAVRGTRHTYWNPDPAPCRYLLAMPPRVHALINALHRDDGREMAEVFLDHRSELLGLWDLPAGVTQLTE